MDRGLKRFGWIVDGLTWMDGLVDGSGVFFENTNTHHKTELYNILCVFLGSAHPA
jgi:hypothetical protein